MISQARAGRPLAKGVRGKKSTIGVRVAHRLKRYLNEESERNDRPLSQEAELVLEAHAERRRSLLDMLDLMYGSEAAGLMLHIGELAIDVQRGVRSLSDPWTFDELRKAIEAELPRIKPKGEIVPPATVLHRDIVAPVAGSAAAANWPDYERKLIENYGLNAAGLLHQWIFERRQPGERPDAIRARLPWVGAREGQAGADTPDT